MWLNLVLTFLIAFVIAMSDLSVDRKVFGIVAFMVQAAVALFVLRLITELIDLSVNLAQDTERILRAKEAEVGKPWAKP